MHAKSIVAVLAALFLVSPYCFAQQPASAQTAAPSRDPQATALLQKSLNNLVGQISIADVTLNGTAIRTSGSDSQSGSATLKATSIGQSRVDLVLSAGNRSEVRDVSVAPPTGTWSGPDSSVHPISQHNLLTAPAWFFPAFVLTAALSNSNYAISPIDQETKLGTTVNHVTVFQQISVPGDTMNLFQKLSQMDIYLDPSSLFPVAIDIAGHPDTNAVLNIPTEFQFSNYSATGGATVPFHIQELINNVVLLDIQISQVTFNTGLSSDIFALQ